MLQGLARFSCVCCVLVGCGSDKGASPSAGSGGVTDNAGGHTNAGAGQSGGGSNDGGRSSSQGGRAASAGTAGVQSTTGGRTSASGGQANALGGSDVGGAAEGGDGTMPSAGVSGASSDFCPSRWCWSHPLPQGTGANAIWIVPDGNVWIGGEGGTFARWNGQRWQYFTADAEFNQVILSIWGSTADDLWATNGDELFRFDGQSWRKFASPAGANGSPFFHQISGSAADDVWFASDEGLYHWTGAAFTAPELPSLSFNWVSVAAAREAWSITKDNQLLSWDGTSWSDATFPDTAPAFQDLWAAAPSNMWLIDNGGAWHWDGSQFSAVDELGTGTGYLNTQSLFGAGPDDIWLLSATDVQHRVGAQVKSVPFDGTASVPRVAMGLPSGEIYAAGPLGRVWQLQGDRLAMITPPLATELSGDFRGVWSDGAGHTFSVGNGWIQNSGSGWVESSITTGVVEADAVWGAAADDVWAVGTRPGVPVSRFTRGLVMHFDGTAWSTVDLPTALGTSFNAVAVAGPGDVWAVGDVCLAGCHGTIWHLSGGVWAEVPASSSTNLLTVVAEAPGNVWVLGYQELDGDKKADHVEHWDGHRFTAEDTGLPPTPGPPIDPRNELGSATPIWAADDDPASGQLWAVGWSNPPSITPRVIHRG